MGHRNPSDRFIRGRPHMQRSRRKLAALRMILAAVTVEKKLHPAVADEIERRERFVTEQDSRGRILACGEQVTSLAPGSGDFIGKAHYAHWPVVKCLAALREEIVPARHGVIPGR